MPVPYNVRFKSLPIRCNKIHLMTVPDFYDIHPEVYSRYASSKRVRDYFLSKFSVRSKYLHVPSGSIFTGRQIYDLIFNYDLVVSDLVSDRFKCSPGDVDLFEFFAGQNVFVVFEKYFDLCSRNFVHVLRRNGYYVPVK